MSEGFTVLATEDVLSNDVEVEVRNGCLGCDLGFAPFFDDVSVERGRVGSCLGLAALPGEILLVLGFLPLGRKSVSSSFFLLYVLLPSDSSDISSSSSPSASNSPRSEYSVPRPASCLSILASRSISSGESSRLGCEKA